MNIHYLGIAALTTVPLLTLTAHAATLSLVPVSDQELISVGDPVRVNVQVSDLGTNVAPSLGAYNLDVNFQSTNIALTPNGVTLGDQQLQLNNVSSVHNQTGIDATTVNSASQLNLSEISLNDPALLNAQQADNFTLATLDFTATDAGQTPVDLAVIQLADADGQELSADSSGTVIAVARDLKRTVPGLSQLQLSTGRALQTICQRSLREGSGDEALTALACSVDTLAIEAPDQLASTLQNVAGEETFATAAMAMRTTLGLFTTLKQQLAARRRGQRNLDPESLTSQQQGQFLLTLADLQLTNARGGSAGNTDDGLLNSGRLGGFIKASANFGETDATRREDGFDFNKEDVILGIDYRLTDQLIAGLALGYSYYNANFNRSPLVVGGDTESNAYLASFYTTYYLDNFYVDGIFSYSHSDYDVTRRIVSTPHNLNATAVGTPESDQYAGSLNLGYELNQGGLTYGPYARVSYLNLEIERYQEGGAKAFNLSIDEQQVESLESVLAAQIAYAFSQPFGVIMPQFRAEWHHEFLENSQNLTARLADVGFSQRSNDPDRDFVNLSAGVSSVFQGGLQAFLTYETILAQRNIESHLFSAGVRLTF